MGQPLHAPPAIEVHAPDRAPVRQLDRVANASQHQLITDRRDARVLQTLESRRSRPRPPDAVALAPEQNYRRMLRRARLDPPGDQRLPAEMHRRRDIVHIAVAHADEQYLTRINGAGADLNRRSSSVQPIGWSLFGYCSVVNTPLLQAILKTRCRSRRSVPHTKGACILIVPRTAAIVSPAVVLYRVRILQWSCIRHRQDACILPATGSGSLT